MRAIVDKDIATLQSVPRVGRKKAERLILDRAAERAPDVDDGEAAGEQVFGLVGKEIAHALLARELFPKAPLKWMPPTRNPNSFGPILSPLPRLRDIAASCGNAQAESLLN